MATPTEQAKAFAEAVKDVAVSPSGSKAMHLKCRCCGFPVLIRPPTTGDMARRAVRCSTCLDEYRVTITLTANGPVVELTQ